MSTPPAGIMQFYPGTTVCRADLTFAPRQYTPLVLDFGETRTDGKIAVTLPLLSGAFADFGLTPSRYGTFPLSYTDPVVTDIVHAKFRDTDVTITDPVNEWVRLDITATAPNFYAPGPFGELSGRAAYARPGVTVLNFQSGFAEQQRIAYAQFEKTPPGRDPETDQFGSNLFSLEQSSYEGRMLYTPSTDASSFKRSTLNPSCGFYSGRYTYEQPTQNNSYTEIKKFKSYANMKARRPTYAAVRNIPYGTQDDPARNVFVPATIFELVPSVGAMVRVQPGLMYTAQISIATDGPNYSMRCLIFWFDKDFVRRSGVTGPPVASIGGGRYQQLQTAPRTAPPEVAWAAVVPRVISLGGSRVVFDVDEHRLWSAVSWGPSPPVQPPLPPAIPDTLARPWQPARQMTIRLSPDRTNLSTNPAMLNNLVGYTSVISETMPEPTLNRVLGEGLGGGNVMDWRIADVAVASYQEPPGWSGVTSGDLTLIDSKDFDLGSEATLLLPPVIMNQIGTHQNVAWDHVNGWMFVTQLMDGGIKLPDEALPVSKDDRNARGDICVNRMTLAGVVDQIFYARGMGHNSSFGVQPVGPDSYLWLEADSPVAKPPANGYGRKIAYMKFVGAAPGTTPVVVDSGDGSMQLFDPKPGQRINIVTLDFPSRRLALRWTPAAAGSQARYSVYDLDVFKMGTFIELAPPVLEPTEILTYQSHALYRDTLYVNEGTGYADGNVPPGNQYTSAINWRTGQLVERVKNDTDSDLNWREPEALNIYYGPNGPRLAFGYSTPNPGRRNMKLWSYGLRQLMSANPLISGLKPNTTYTASVYVRSLAALVPITLWANDGDIIVRGTSTPMEQLGSASPFYRLRVTFTTATTFSGTLELRLGYDSSEVSYVYGPVEPGTDTRIWRQTTAVVTDGNWTPTAAYIRNDVVAHNLKRWRAQGYTGAHPTVLVLRFRATQFLVEETSELTEYFDGDNPSSDYVWEGARGNSRSLNYRGRRVNQYRLEKLVAEQLPVGTSHKIVYSQSIQQG